MRRFSAGLIATVSTFAMASMASAADMPTKAPPLRPPVGYNWTGSYIGGHIGYGWGSDPVEFAPISAVYAPAFASGSLPTSLADNARGVLGGIQYGTNWQFNRIVLGWDSDLSFSDIRASQSVTNGTPAFVSTADQKLTLLSTTRGRIGYTLTDNLLLYGTGGLAAGRASAISTFYQTACGPGSCVAGSDSKTLWGWAAGGGVEYAMGHWLLRAEYLHYDLGDLDYSMADPRTPGQLIAASTKFSGDIVRGAISYKFDWTVWDLLFSRR
jgi:outer membrane immunogenic protein